MYISDLVLLLKEINFGFRFTNVPYNDCQEPTRTFRAKWRSFLLLSPGLGVADTTVCVLMAHSILDIMCAVLWILNIRLFLLTIYISMIIVAWLLSKQHSVHFTRTQRDTGWLSWFPIIYEYHLWDLWIPTIRIRRPCDLSLWLDSLYW